MEVYALIGPAGTGKSHRATFVARQYGADVIIDDGLLIHGSRIIAGVSAKRESTALAAVRRAIFTDPDHARQVRDAIRACRPERILILGTSRDMVERICEALDLPHPERYIRIEDVASPDDIRRARRIRRLEGKHVIPAPTFEVKKRFSGYLIDPLRFLYPSRRRKGGQGEGVVIEKSMVRPTFSSLGRFYIADTVVTGIVQHAVKTVPGVVGCSRVSVSTYPEGVTIVADLVFRFGTKLVPAMQQARQRAIEQVESLTALNVLSMEVIARRVVPPESG